MVKKHFANQTGLVHLPMTVALSALVALGFGTWGALRSWNARAQTQLRLDRCVGAPALILRSTLRTLASSNREIEALRASILAATLAPQLIPPLRTALALEVSRQDLLLLRWRATRLRWLVPGSCGAVGDRRLPLPDLHYLRPTPDPLGPRPLEWTGLYPDSFRIVARNSSRAAAARIFSQGGTPNDTTWKAEWIPPFQRTNPD